MSFIIVLCSALFIVPSMAAEPVDSGTCGENLTWTLDSDGVLTISGMGSMRDYNSDSPWSSYGEHIKSVVVGYGVTGIGSAAFEGCSALSAVTIGSGVTSIGNYAFSNCSSLGTVTIPDSVTGIGNSAF